MRRVECASCGTLKPHVARGMCKRCYNHWYQAGKGAAPRGEVVRPRPVRREHLLQEELARIGCAVHECFPGAIGAGARRGENLGDVVIGILEGRIGMDDRPDTLLCDITLPYPPSVNHYYRRAAGRMLLSKAGREYKRAVAGRVMCYRPSGRVAASMPVQEAIALRVYLKPPDARRRDIDNTIKPLLDALEGHLFENDHQVRELKIRWLLPLRPRGEVRVVMTSGEWLNEEKG